MRCYKKKLRLLISILALAFSLLPEYCIALGFGQIKLYSYLNEPLDAEIDLVGAENIDRAQMMAALASVQDFKRAEIARPYFLSQLRFELQKERKRTFIKVTTDEVVNNPFLEFLVVLNWSEGRLVKDFTLLLDPAPMGGAAKRQGKKLSQSSTPAVDKHTLLRMHEKVAEQRVQEKLSRALSNPTRLAQIEAGAGDGMMESDANPQIMVSNPAVQQLENLFDAVDKQEVAAPPIPKAVAVSVQDSVSGQDLSVEEKILEKNVPFQVLSRQEKSDQEQDRHDRQDKQGKQDREVIAENKKGDSRTGDAINFSDPIADDQAILKTNQNKSFWVVLGENSLILMSGMSLLFVVAFTVWFLKRAAQRGITQRVKPGIDDFETLLTGQDELFKDEIMMKLTLARQYLDIQDNQSAKEVLEELINHSNKSVREAAKILLSEILTPVSNVASSTSSSSVSSIHPNSSSTHTSSG
jgi:FimV-like protein